MAKNKKKNKQKEDKVLEEEPKKEMEQEEDVQSETSAKEKSPDINDQDQKEKPSSRVSSEGDSEEKVEKETASGGPDVSRMIVGIEDELPDVLEGIESGSAKRVVVSIPSGSDLLVSSVSMKLITEAADKLEKDIVIVTDDQVGSRMARLAGLLVKQKMTEVDEDLWETAGKMRKERKENKERPQAQKTSEVQENSDISEDSAGKEMPIQNNITEEQVPDTKGVESLEEKKTAVSEKASLEPEEKMDLGRDSEPSSEKASPVRTVSQGDFEMTIDSSPIGKSAGEKPVGKLKSVPSDSTEQRRSFVGRDFSGYEIKGAKPDVSKDEIPTSGQPIERAMDKLSTDGDDSIIGILKQFITKDIPNFFKNLFANKLFKKLIFPVVLVSVILMAFLVWYLPEVIVNIEVDSIPVEYSDSVTALTSADELDADDLIIPARDEVVSKSGSDNADATGVASRGEKASGSVLIFNSTTSVVSLEAGTVLSDGDGHNFLLQSAVTLDAANPPTIPMTQATGNVIAENAGTEYNLGAGTTFAVATFQTEEVYAANSAAFTGGTKEDYKVVSQEDIDNLADKIRDGLYEEAKSELSRENSGTRWVFVESSVKNELDGDIESDVPAGSEETSFNVSVKVKCTALYYDGDALEKLIEDKLLDDVGEDGDMEGLELSENIDEETSVSSASVDEGKINLSVSVSGYVMPHLDEDKIVNGLLGKGWADGIKFLKKLDYISGEPEIEFFPGWFPRFAWRMPSREGRITVKIKNVVPDEDSESDSD